MMEKRLVQLQEKRRDRFAVLLDDSPASMHRILAAADILLNSSRLEPSGLTQLYAMRYGAVPVARSAAGSKDIIHEVEDFSGEGWGFLFRATSPDDMMEALFRAVDLYGNPRTWRRVVRQAMKQDFSWEKSAGQYARLFKDILAQRRKAA